jgi:hypothetical protein
MALGKKTGGRSKGTPNKSTVARAEELAAGGELPRDYMLRVMRDPTVDHARRDEMAKAVAPYVHAKLQAMTVEGKDGGPIVMTWRAPTMPEGTGG